MAERLDEIRSTDEASPYTKKSEHGRLQQSRQTAFIWGAVLVPVCKLEDELSQLRGRHSK